MILFGVIESKRLGGLFSYNDGAISLNHDQLFSKIKQISINDPNLTVGLEPSSKEKEWQVGNLTFRNQPIYLELGEYFTNKGNKIYLLESSAYDKETAKLAERMSIIKKELGASNGEASKKSLELEYDKLGIEIAYMSMLGKETNILENIARYKPSLVFLGAAHAARFYKNSAELAQKHGIAFEEYWEETCRSLTEHEIMMAAANSSEHVSMEDCLSGIVDAELRKIESPENAVEDPFSEFATRLFKSIKENRITNGTPTSMGTFNLEAEHRGLFEFYVKEAWKEAGFTYAYIKGGIEDPLGSGTFVGRVSDNYIKFTKIYTKAYNENAVLDKQIIYEGTVENGEFIGRFTFPDGYSEGFKMKRFEIPKQLVKQGFAEIEKSPTSP